MELDVTEQRQAHKQDQRRVQQDQPRLGDMRIIYRTQAHIQRSVLGFPLGTRLWQLTEQDQTRAERGHDDRVTRLPHDPENHGDRR